VAIGVPADLIDTPWFGRPIEVRTIDYLILGVTAGLIGLIFAIRPASTDVAFESQERTTVWGGFVSFLAVGCPVCNQAVVALVGTSGALSWWAPVQPVVGLIAVALLLYTLRKRLNTYDLASCPVPVR
jgi:nitrate/nitrite transporter NarK